MKTINKPIAILVITLAIVTAGLFAFGLSSHAETTFHYPNGKTVSDYDALKSTYTGYGLKSYGTIESGDDIEIHAADFYYLYDVCK